MNYKTRPLTEEEFQKIILTLEKGYEYGGIQHRPNRKVATALVTETILGIRISDVLNLRLSSIKRDGDRYRLNIIEQFRTFVVSNDVYMYLKGYASDYKMSEEQKLFDISERQVQKILQNVCEYLDLKGISTHSFRQLFVYKCNHNECIRYGTALGTALLSHPSYNITSGYIGAFEELGVSRQLIDDLLSSVGGGLLEYVKK